LQPNLDERCRDSRGSSYPATRVAHITTSNSQFILLDLLRFIGYNLTVSVKQMTIIFRRISIHTLSTFHASARPQCQTEALCTQLFHQSVRSFVRLSVCYQTCKHDILKTNKLISMQIGTSGLRGKGMERSTLGLEGQRSRHTTLKIDWRPGRGIILDSLGSGWFSSRSITFLVWAQTERLSLSTVLN